MQILHDFLFPVLQVFTQSIKYQSHDVLTPPFLLTCALSLHTRCPRSCVPLVIQPASVTRKAKLNRNCCIPFKWIHAIFKLTLKNTPDIPRGNKLTMRIAAWNHYTDSSGHLVLWQKKRNKKKRLAGFTEITWFSKSGTSPSATKSLTSPRFINTVLCMLVFPVWKSLLLISILYRKHAYSRGLATALI